MILDQPRGEDEVDRQIISEKCASDPSQKKVILKDGWLMEAAYPTVRPDEFDVVINYIRNEDVANIGAMLQGAKILVTPLVPEPFLQEESCMAQATAYLYRSLWRRRSRL